MAQAKDKLKADELVFRHALPLAHWVDQITLLANTAATVTIPAWADLVNFSTTGAGGFHVRTDGGAAVVPASTKTDGSGSLTNPVLRRVNGGETFSIIATNAMTVSIEWFSRDGRT